MIHPNLGCNTHEQKPFKGCNKLRLCCQRTNLGEGFEKWQCIESGNVKNELIPALFWLLIELMCLWDFMFIVLRYGGIWIRLTWVLITLLKAAFAGLPVGL